jgi:hypothetical protein
MYLFNQNFILLSMQLFIILTKACFLTANTIFKIKMTCCLRAQIIATIVVTSISFALKT